MNDIKSIIDIYRNDNNVLVFNNVCYNRIKTNFPDFKNPYEDITRINQYETTDLESFQSYSWIRVEDFIALKSNNKLQKDKFKNKTYIIISDPTLEYIPFQFNDEIDDSENSEEEKNNILDNFYSHYFTCNNKIYVKSQSINILRENLSLKINEEFVQNLIPTLTKNVEYKNLIYDFSEGNKEFMIFVDQLFLNDIITDAEITFDVSTNTDQYFISFRSLLERYDCKFESTVTLNEKDFQFPAEIDPNLNTFLQKFGYQEFRSVSLYKMPLRDRKTSEINQGILIQHIINQSYNSQKGYKFYDILITSPTGSGKSLLFQLAAYYLMKVHNELTIIVTPLQALMVDQVQNIKAKNIEGFEYINANRTNIERTKIKARISNFEISVLYISPEMLNQVNLQDWFGERQIGLFVVDEAHTVIHWGASFRPDYIFLKGVIRKLQKNQNRNFPVFSLTATATENTDETKSNTKQIIKKLGRQIVTTEILIGQIKRTNIEIKVNPQTLNQNENLTREKIRLTADFISNQLTNTPEDRILVYTPFKADNMRATFENNSRINIRDRLREIDHNAVESTEIYHSEINYNIKEKILKEYKEGTLKAILATNAFGMGVDIPNIRKVYHTSVKGSLADYIQEIGRAGRDGMQSKAYIDYFGNPNEFSFWNKLFHLSGISHFTIQQIAKRIIEKYDQKKSRKFFLNLDDFSDLNEANSTTRVITTDEHIVWFKRCLLAVQGDMKDDRNFSISPKKINSHYYFQVVNRQIPNFINAIANNNFDLFDTFIKNQQEYTIFKVNLESYCAKRNLDLIKTLIHLSTGIRSLNNMDNKYPFLQHSKIATRFDFTFSQQLNDIISTCESKFDSIINCLKDLFNLGRGNERRSVSENKIINTLSTLFDENLAKEVKEVKAKQCFGLFVNYRFTRDKKANDYFTCNLDNSDNEDINYQQNSAYTDFRQVKIDCIDILKSIKETANNSIWASKENETDKIDAFAKTKRLAQFLEIFDLATYETFGSSNPSFFVFIEPHSLRKIASKEEYRNSTIHNLYEFKTKEQENFNTLFVSKKTSEERWDFIENYFLGLTIQQED